METEIEAKFLGINQDRIRKELSALKAEIVHPERLMRRKVFDYPDSRLEKKGGWVRVRDEGDKITVSYKQLIDRTLHGTKEITFTVNDFDKACSFLTSIGLMQKSYQETKREKWLLDNVEVTIDTWPWIPAFVEIEGASEGLLKDTSKKLGLDWSKAMHGSVETAYQRYFEVTEAEVDSWEKISFIPTPDWLESKRKIKSY